MVLIFRRKKRNEKGCVPIYAASGINGYHDQVKAKGPGIVTGRSGTLGIVNLVLEDHWPLNTSLWVKEFKGCTAFYAYYLLDSIGLERFNSGASVPTLNRNDVHGNPVIAPPKELIKKFENIVCVNHKQINVLKRKNENLKKTA
ncbi:restriction endonuclease subunit S [Vibrio parahaemolyticus]|nr:restriction endonuclease subunit S [Vibrio parahaemolyticus]